MTNETAVQPDMTRIGREAYYSPSYVKDLMMNELQKWPLWRGALSERPDIDREIDRFLSGDYFNFQVERVFTVSCRLNINVRGTGRETINNYRLNTVKFEVGIGWPTSPRSLHACQASLVLYQEMLNLACTLQSIADQHDCAVIEEVA